MDYHQQNDDDDNYSILTYSQHQNSLSLTSSIASTGDLTLKTTNSFMMSNINVDRSMTRNRSLRKRHYQEQKQIEHNNSSQSTTIITEENIKEKKFSKIQKQEARPLGTCVRNCDQCRQLKHILLAECTVCLRMMDIDLKDCKCQIIQNENIIDHFICSICNSELTLNGYIICANRTCQTTLSALIYKENINEFQEKSILSSIITNIYYPTGDHRTVAIQVNTLIDLPPLQRLLSTIIDNENEELLSLSSSSKRNLDWTFIRSSDSSDISHISIDSSVDAPRNHITKNITTPFNSNQPTKLALQSEDELQQQQQQSRIHNVTNINNSQELIKMPKSPRCLAIMNVRKHHNRLSTLLKLQTNKTCQTQLSCLTNIDKMIKCEELSNIIFIQTNNPNKIECQIQVNTIKDYFHDTSQVHIEINDHLNKNLTKNITNDEKILQALIDRDGQRWSELIDQLINEQDHILPSEIAQQLLDTIERLHTAEKLNNLTQGQLQRKIRYAMSQFKHIDEHSYLQNNLKEKKFHHAKKSTECNGRIDMAVTVRQIDKYHNHQTIISTEHNWKPYVDRLFDQGYSADEIQRLLREAAEISMQSDDQRLQNVFNYINTKAKQQTLSSGIAFISTKTKTKPVICQQTQSIKSKEIMTRRSSLITEKKMISNESSPIFTNKDQSSIMKIIKNKTSLSNTSPHNDSIKPSVIQVELPENISTIDFNKDEKEQNLSTHSSTEQQYVNIITNPNATTPFKQKSITSTDLRTRKETNNDIKSDSNNIGIILEQRTSQISKPDVTSSFNHLNSSSTILITPSYNTTDTSLRNLEEKCIYALHHIQNIINNTDVHLYPHLLNMKFELNKLIDMFELDNINHNNIEFLMTQCIELLNNTKETIKPQLKEIYFQNFNEEISNTLNLLQEYKKIALPFIKTKEDFLFNQHTSNILMIPSDTSTSLKQIEENIEQTIESQSQLVPLSSNTILDLKQQNIISEYQETIGLIQCSPIPYASSNEKVSTETLKPVLICSTEHISLNSEQLIMNKNDPNNILNISSKTEDELYDDQSQIKWLNSLLSKLSDDISRTSNIASESSSILLIDQTKIDHNDKQKEEQEERQESIITNHSKSLMPIHQHITNVLEPTGGSQNILYETDVITFKDEHATPIIIPDHISPISNQQYQITQTKLLQNQSVTSSNQMLNSKDQLTLSEIEKNNENIIQESSYSNVDSSHMSQKSSSSSIDTLHSNKFDEKRQLSSSHSNVDSSDQLDQLQMYENTISSQQSIPASASTSEENFESSQKLFDNENREKISSTLILEDTMLPKTDINTIPKTTSTELLSFPLDENKDQLPVLTQYHRISNAIQSNSLLIDLNDLNNTLLYQELLPNDNSILSVQKRSSIDSEKQEKVSDEKTKQLIPSSSSTMVKTSSEDVPVDKCPSSLHFFMEQSSELMASPLIKTTTTDDDNDKKFSKFLSSKHDLPNDNILKEDLKNKLNHISTEVQNEHNSPILSNTSTQESSSFNDTIRTLSSSITSKENLTTDKTNDQQSKPQLIINRTFSQPKIAIEDIQTPPISTPHSSLISTTFDDHINNKFEKKAQFISENTESLNVPLPTIPYEEIQSNKILIEKNSSSSENSLFQLEQSRHAEDHSSTKKNSLKSESLIKQISPSSDKLLIMDNYNETNDAFDQNHPSSLVKLEYDNNKDRLDNLPRIDNSDIKQTDSSSPMIVKRQPISSSTTATLPSSITNVNTQDQDLKPHISVSESQNNKSTIDNALIVTPEENQGPISTSSFNRAYLTDIPSDNQHETEGEINLSQKGKSLTDNNLHSLNSKHQSPLTNPLNYDRKSSYSMPKLLLKRSSIKQTSNTAQSIKPNTTLSITDVSTSSSNTVATDNFLSTHSTISDQEEIISLKKINKINKSKNKFMTTSNTPSKRNILRKTSRTLEHQSLIPLNQKEQHINKSKKKFTDNSLLTNSELIYDTEPGSDIWMKSHEDISQILIINEQDEKKPQIYGKKQNKTRIIDGSRLISSNLKARGDRQAYNIDSSRLPSIEQPCGEHHIKKYSNNPSRRPIIRYPITQIEKFQCGTIGPHIHPSSIAHQLFSLPSIHNHQNIPSEFYQPNESFTDRFYSLMSSENNNDDKQAFESIVNYQQYQIPKIEQNKYQYMYLLDTSRKNAVRGKQYSILPDEIDMIDDPNTCTIVNKWAFADLVNAEREKYHQESIDNIKKTKIKKNRNTNIKICLLKRPLTKFEQNIFKEVDIISIIDSQTLFLHIPSITVDNQVFIKNRKFKCDQTFNEYCKINTIYHSTLAPLLNIAIDGNKCLCLIGGGKYSGKTSLLRLLIDLFAIDLIRLLSTYDIYIKLLGICHNRIVDLLQNYSPIRIIKSINSILIPNDEFHLQNHDDIDYIKCQIKKRRKFIHQLIQINFRQNNQSTIIGSLMIVMLASSQYVYTRNLCSHRKKFLINSLNRTILSFKRALLGIRQNPDRIHAAFNNDILTRLIQPYVFHDKSNICYIGTLNPGHRHRTATKSTLEFARNLRFCLKYIKKQRRKQEKLSQMNSNNDDTF